MSVSWQRRNELFGYVSPEPVRQTDINRRFKWQKLPRKTRVEAGSNSSTVTPRVVGGDEKGSLKSETVKYGCESQGTRTQGWLRWQRPAAYTDRSTRLLVREGVPQKQDRNFQTVIYVCLVMSPRRKLDTKTYWLTDWPSVAMWLWLWLSCQCSIRYLS
jgi:hypothetical protein